MPHQPSRLPSWLCQRFHARSRRSTSKRSTEPARMRSNWAAARVSEGHLQPLLQRPGGSRHRLDPLSKTYAVLAVVHRETHGNPFKASCALASAQDDAGAGAISRSPATIRLHRKAEDRGRSLQTLLDHGYVGDRPAVLALVAPACVKRSSRSILASSAVRLAETRIDGRRYTGVPFTNFPVNCPTMRSWAVTVPVAGATGSPPIAGVAIAITTAASNAFATRTGSPANRR